MMTTRHIVPMMMAAGLLCGGFAGQAARPVPEVKTAPAAVPAAAPEAAPKVVRVLDINDTVSCRNGKIVLRDLVGNAAVLTDEEAEYEIMKTPTAHDVNLSLVDVAYLLQRFPSLVSARIRGPRFVLIKHLRDMRYVDLAKQELLKFIRNNPPWKGWDVDIALSQSDEVLINRAGAFKRLEVLPYDNTSMIGTVGFRVSLYDDHDRMLSRLNLNPVILRKMDALVMRENMTIGHIVQRSDLKKVPVWVGGEKKGYVTDEKECVGKELARSVSSGELLRKPDLLNPVCAKRGQVIWVNCVSGALSVKLAVLATENGRLGDMIKVQNRSTNKEFSVELTGPKQGLHRMGS